MSSSTLFGFDGDFNGAAPAKPARAETGGEDATSGSRPDVGAGDAAALFLSASTAPCRSDGAASARATAPSGWRLVAGASSLRDEPEWEPATSSASAFEHDGHVVVPSAEY